MVSSVNRLMYGGYMQIYAILYKRLEHAWILVSSWVLEQINS